MRSSFLYEMFFLVIYISQINVILSGKVQRNAVAATPILTRLTVVDKSLQMSDNKGIPKQKLTDEEDKWIKRFENTAKKWVTAMNQVTEEQSYKEIYKTYQKIYFDKCSPGDGSNIITVQQLIAYGKYENDPWFEKSYMVPFSTCLGGFGMSRVKLNLIKIFFETSAKIMRTPIGKWITRKDRVYVAEIEAHVPKVSFRIKHKIIRSIPRPEVLDAIRAENGIMIVELTNVKIFASLRLTQIDKQFVQRDQYTGLIYYFRLPEITELTLSVGSVKDKTRTGGKLYVDPSTFNIKEQESQNLKDDLVNLFTSTEGLAELSDRLKPVLINRSAEAIMTAPDIVTVPEQLYQAWDKILTETQMPPLEWPQAYIRLRNEAFYTTLDIENLKNKVLSFSIANMQSILKNGKSNIKVIEERPYEEYDVDGLSVHDDGFHYSKSESSPPSCKDVGLDLLSYVGKLCGKLAESIGSLWRS